MRKMLGSKGAEMVEYAIVLACIAALGVTFSDNLKSTMGGLFDNVSSVMTALGSDKDESEKDKLLAAINDKNMKWMQNFWAYAEAESNYFASKFGNTLNQRKDDNFKNNDGIFDSAAGTKFVSDIESKAGNELDMKDCSWAMAGYKDADGNLWYNVSIYNPAKNNGTSLADQKVGNTITTDIYLVNASNGQITKKTGDATQAVASRTNGGKTYNVIRDL